ncbi:MAG: sigma-70 family RNA polymerase sigma factor [Leptospiraceae bacterium]|nr:sigma-70 family RNA polymerase sigma factor [Leptospiraceae bacterium]
MQTTALWQEFQQNLTRFIGKRVSNPQDAEDILQSVFEKIHRRADQLEQIQKPGAWLYRITRNQIIDYYRSHQQTVELPDELIYLDQKPDSDRSRFFEQCLTTFLSDVDEAERQILQQHWAGMSLKALAHQNGQSYSAVKARIRRLRAKLRRRFVDCCQIQSSHAELPAENSDCRSC